jgi:N6-adenosine-specific RNA methylase IME4
VLEGFTERLSESRNSRVQSVFKVAERFPRPEATLQLLARDDRAGRFDQGR